MAKVVAIIQARMTSTRLPGKVMMEIGGQPMLWHVLERVRRTPGIDAVWVATTDDGSEAPIVALCDSMAVPYHRGDTADVLARYHETAQKSAADVIVRITSDCPLIDPQVTGRCVAAYRAANGAVDYVSNGLLRTFPRGLDTEVFSRACLDTAFSEAHTAPEREHVTPFIWGQPERFKLLNVADKADHSALRWTVDTPEDLALVRKIYGIMGSNRSAVSYTDILALYADHPVWQKINVCVAQKNITD